MSISWFFCLSFLVYGYHLMGDGVTAWLFKRNDIMTESCLANITTSILLSISPTQEPDSFGPC